MANPYQLSSIRTNLDSLRNIQGMDRQQSLIDVLNQKQKISEDYEKDVEAIQKDARDRAGKHSGILKGIKGIATLFGGPLANAIVGGVPSGVQLKQQKSGAKMLQNKAMDRYSRNFMSQQADTFKEQADEAQLSSGDVLRGAFGSGVSSYLGSKMMGGDDGSIYKKLTSNIEKETGKKIFQGGVKDMLKPRGIFGETGSEFLPNPTAIDRLRGAWQGSGDLISPLADSLKKGGNFKGGMDEMQSTMMIPLLLQQMFGLGE